NISLSNCTGGHRYNIVAKTTTSEMVRADTPGTTDSCPLVTKPPKTPTTTPAPTINDSLPPTKDDGHTNAEIMEVGTSHPTPPLVSPMSVAVRIEQSTSLLTVSIVLSPESAKLSEETKVIKPTQSK